MPVLRKAPEKLFSKVIISKGYGFNTPQDGSVCKIKVIADEMSILTSVDDTQMKEIVVGDVDESTDRVIEDCIRTMKEEEECCIKFQHPCLHTDCVIPVEMQDNETNESLIESTEMVDLENESNNLSPTDTASESKIETKETVQQINEASDLSLEAKQSTENKSEANVCVPSTNENASSNLVEIQFQLLSYTREPEIWEMSITEKWRRASYHKQRGLELYSRGAYQYAFRRFGLTFKYVISLEHDIPSGQEEGMDIRGLKLSCYLNVAACQMRHHNFESVVINSTKALIIQPNNAKALYRRGAAYLQLQEYEKAKEDLSSAQQLEPKNQAVAKQMQILKCRVQKLNQYYASAMKKLFS
ncbi:70 kDa peptidyl-prolyl isomerase-like [Stegodyphus dumicola]|uniref:70 kDa peptidyl-prolyl isomerase-like n=1 Tax=Stegodyphus dumicola TaxID=202533 RepID=UPI0015ADE372|nr:70 kDa peptidyl-prolyl isomerase-like [Stegodyphus dumicola]